MDYLLNFFSPLSSPKFPTPLSEEPPVSKPVSINLKQESLSITQSTENQQSAPLCDDGLYEPKSQCRPRPTKSLSSRSLNEGKHTVRFHDQPQIIDLEPLSSFDREECFFDPEDFDKMLQRNSLEFQAEGRNWKTVVEEENMIKNEHGELVHPVHVLRNFCLLHTKKTDDIKKNSNKFKQRKPIRKLVSFLRLNFTHKIASDR